MSCNSEIRQLLESYVKGELDEIYKMNVESHLRTCSECMLKCLGLIQVTLDTALANTETEFVLAEFPWFELKIYDIEQELLQFGEQPASKLQRFRQVVHTEHIIRKFIEEFSENFIRYINEPTEIAIFDNIKKLFFESIPIDIISGDPIPSGVGLIGKSGAEGDLSASILATTAVLVEQLIRERIMGVSEEKIDEKYISELLNYIKKSRPEIEKAAMSYLPRKYIKDYTEQFLIWFHDELERKGLPVIREIKAGLTKEKDHLMT